MDGLAVDFQEQVPNKYLQGRNIATLRAGQHGPPMPQPLRENEEGAGKGRRVDSKCGSESTLARQNRAPTPDAKESRCLHGIRGLVFELLA